jgi:hypothetical protein
VHRSLLYETAFRESANKIITEVTGKFYDKRGSLAVDCSRTVLAVEDPPNIDILIGHRQQGRPIARRKIDFMGATQVTNGVIDHIMTGDRRDESAPISLDGAFVADGVVTGCNLEVTTTFWVGEGAHFMPSNNVGVGYPARFLPELLAKCKVKDELSRETWGKLDGAGEPPNGESPSSGE